MNSQTKNLSCALAICLSVGTTIYLKPKFDDQRSASSKVATAVQFDTSNAKPTAESQLLEPQSSPTQSEASEQKKAAAEDVESVSAPEAPDPDLDEMERDFHSIAAKAILERMGLSLDPQIDVQSASFSRDVVGSLRVGVLELRIQSDIDVRVYATKRGRLEELFNSLRSRIQDYGYTLAANLPDPALRIDGKLLSSYSSSERVGKLIVIDNAKGTVHFAITVETKLDGGEMTILRIDPIRVDFSGKTTAPF